MSHTPKMKSHVFPRVYAMRSGHTVCFVNGLFMGLGGAVYANLPPQGPRHYHSAGLVGDWRAVGGDMKTVMRKMNATE